MIQRVSSTNQGAISDKLSRLKKGKSPRVLDLFAGCGGLSLGAHLAGGDILGAVEIDPIAARTHAINFHDGSEVHAISRDITNTPPDQLLSDFGIPRRSQHRTVDIIVGGPPCQAFARVGRAKLREIASHPDAFLHDERSGLYRDYLSYVEALSPIAVVIENVPDVLNYGGLNVYEVIAGALEAAGYNCIYGLLNSAHYGVPQMRTRCFLIGISKQAKVQPSLPIPTHSHPLPPGYEGTRSVAIKYLHQTLEHRFIESPPAPANLPPAVTASEAISDLPRITSHLKGLLKKGPRRFDHPIPCPAPNSLHEFAKRMRDWPGFESDGSVADHVIRFLPRDYKIFARMKQGDQYPQAHELANRMFEEEIARHSPRPRPNTKRFAELKSQFVPPYDPNKFPNKWRKMEKHEPARTLLAHLGKDSYSHIHFDSRQARTISVREAARLQSFPDGFQFCGPMNPGFKQIGNAVPPLLANAVIQQLFGDLGLYSTNALCEAQR